MILLGVCGGIAAYKACEVARLMIKAGAQVRVALTPAGEKFVTGLTFQALTGHPVARDLFSAKQEFAAGHIALADWAQLAVVAPALREFALENMYKSYDFAYHPGALKYFRNKNLAAKAL